MSTILIKYLPGIERFVIGSDTHGFPSGWHTWEQATSHLRDQLHYRSDTINTALELACDLAAGPGRSSGSPEVSLIYPPINPYESGE